MDIRKEDVEKKGKPESDPSLSIWKCYHIDRDGLRKRTLEPEKKDNLVENCRRGGGSPDLF